jgi:hypothetical protein
VSDVGRLLIDRRPPASGVEIAIDIGADCRRPNPGWVRLAIDRWITEPLPTCRLIADIALLASI